MPNSLGLLEDALVLRDPHRLELLCSVIFIQVIVGVFPQLLHMRPNQHLSKFDEITVVLIVDLDHTPRVRSSTDLSPIWGIDQIV